MNLGCCTSVQNISILKRQGMNYLELSAGEIASLSEERFEDLLNVLKQNSVNVYSVNCLFPGSVTPLFQDRDLKEAKAYLQKLLPRLKRIGVRCIVFGSGSYRRAPEDVTPETIRQKLEQFLTLLCSMASEEDMWVVIEPLNQGETNVFNTVGESASYINSLCLPNLFLLADLYHFEMEHENLSELRKYASILRHIHIANPKGRIIPSLEDEYNYAPFFDLLKEIEYDGLICLEYGSQNGFLQEEIKKASSLFETMVRQA